MLKKILVFDIILYKIKRLMIIVGVKANKNVSKYNF